MSGPGAHPGSLPEWGLLSPEQRDIAYNNTLAVPDSPDLQRQWLAASQALHERRRPLDIAYGDHERQRIDLFEGGENLLVFIHGGYWQRGGRERISMVAEGPLAHGWSVAFPGYRLTPEVNLDEIVADIWAALDRLAQRGQRIVVAGHSAGGHLTALTLRHDAVTAGIAISGVFELNPVRDTELNANVRLTQAQIETLSPLRLPIVHKPLTIAYGSIELPALIANSRDFHALRSAAHAPGSLLPIPGADHFNVLDALRDPAGALCRALG